MGGALIFVDYVKPGDQMKLEIQQGAAGSLSAKTYLDEAVDAEGLSVSIHKLPDGTNNVANLATHPWQTFMRSRTSAVAPPILH